MKPGWQQRGFSITEVFAVLLVIALLAFGVWFVWHKNKDQPTKTPKSDNSQTQSNQTANPQPDPSEEGKYIVIKEWNLRVTLPQDLRGDISYFVNDIAEKSSGGPLRIDFVSKKFSGGQLKCAVKESAPRTLLGIYYEEVTNGEPDPSNYSPPPFKTIGNRMYFIIGSGCQESIEREGSPHDRELLTNLKEAITNSLESY